MAKRFGRNQKRRLKDELASWKNAHQRESGLLGHVSRQLRSARDEIDAAKLQVARHSGLFAPETVDLGRMRASVPLRLALHGSNRLPDFQELSSMLDMSFSTISLPILMTELKARPDCFGYHAMVEWDDMRWGYAFDRRAASSSSRETLVRHVAETLARQISSDLQRIEAGNDPRIQPNGSNKKAA